MQFITPQWQVQKCVRAASTTKNGGQSRGHWHSFNLGDHVGDEPDCVESNRHLLTRALGLPAAPEWLSQVHGNDVLYVDGAASEQRTADSVWTDQPDTVLSIMTADCLPVLFASKCGGFVAAAHAGWRGLAAGVLQKTVAELPVPADELVAWLGPAIGPDHFEVGDEVRQVFAGIDAANHAAFVPSPLDEKKYFANIFMLAKTALSTAGVKQIYGGGVCTYSDPELFFSYRRDAGVTGRMASLIWISD